MVIHTSHHMHALWAMMHQWLVSLWTTRQLLRTLAAIINPYGIVTLLTYTAENNSSRHMQAIPVWSRQHHTWCSPITGDHASCTNNQQQSSRNTRENCWRIVSYSFISASKWPEQRREAVMLLLHARDAEYWNDDTTIISCWDSCIEVQE